MSPKARGGGRVTRLPDFSPTTPRMLGAPALLTVGSFAAGHELPQHQPHGVHVNAQKGVSLEVDGSLEHLGGHVPPRAHLHEDRGGAVVTEHVQMHTTLAMLFVVDGDGRYYTLIPSAYHILFLKNYRHLFFS